MTEPNYNLTIQNDTGSVVTINTRMPEEVVRMLQLSGIPVHMHADTDAPSDCACSDASVEPEHVVMSVMEQQAEHDYGHDGLLDAFEFDIKDYNWEGRADLPERLTSARYGSNPLKSDMREHAEYERLKQLYEQFLSESDNKGGVMSPLTADARQEFDKDPLADENPVTDGSRSPLSRVQRQDIPR